MKKRYFTFLLLFFAGLVRLQAQTPIYNSYPSATATILLDFDGQYVDGTPWNWAGPINCGPSGMSPAQITEIFNRIAEDYRPFKINITTDSTKYWSAPALQRTRLIFTVTSDWYGPAGGVSYVNSFTWGDNTPAFVFSALLGYRAKWVGEAASHEIGHTLGLRHQSSYDANCMKTAEYNAGTGDGEIAWAPIMGVGYYRNFTLWNNGANPYGCTSYQDDLSIITSADNGFGYRADDYSAGTNGGATPMTLNGSQLTASGVIERITDQDAFKFTVATATNFRLDAVPFNIGTGNVGSNLDLEIQLFSSGNNLIGVYNPSSMLNVVVDTVLLPGNYWIRVQGKGNLFAPEYASLGSYSLRATVGGTPLPVRRLELNGNVLNGRHQLAWTIDADERVISQSLEVSANGRDFRTLAAPAFTDRVYQYTPAPGGQSYRVLVTFENGRQYYSNVVRIRENGTRPQLASVQTGAITIQSPAAGSYAVLDYSGRQLASGKLLEGTTAVATGSLASGIYIVRYELASGVSSEKFMKK